MILALIPGRTWPFRYLEALEMSCGSPHRAPENVPYKTSIVIAVIHRIIVDSRITYSVMSGYGTLLNMLSVSPDRVAASLSLIGQARVDSGLVLASMPLCVNVPSPTRALMDARWGYIVADSSTVEPCFENHGD